MSTFVFFQDWQKPSFYGSGGGPEQQEDMIYKRTYPDYIGFWMRLIAYFIDGVLLVIINWLFPLNAWGDRIIDFMYFTILPCTSWQGTVGKRMIGAVIVDEEGKRISYFKSVLRYLAQILSALILCIGYIMIGFSETKRGLHDWIASTFVLSRNSQLYP